MNILWGPVGAITEEQLNLLFGDLRVAQVIVWLVALGALFAIVAANWKRIKYTFQIADALIALPDTMALVHEIHHEVKPNTGTSLNDSQRRTEAIAIETKQQVDKLEKDFTKFKQASIEVDGELRAEMERLDTQRRGGFKA